MTYRVLAHIENSEGIYIAAECPLEHSANGWCFYMVGTERDEHAEGVVR